MTDATTDKTLLVGHISPETAYTVEDYPYGFRLRCRIRYWLEGNPKRGYRWCSQTTNPKRAEERWNAPKKSTYSRIAAVMFLNADQHVKWCSFPDHADNIEDMRAWVARHGDALTKEMHGSILLFFKVKERFEARRAEEHAKGNTNWPFAPSNSPESTAKHPEPVLLTDLIKR